MRPSVPRAAFFCRQSFANPFTIALGILPLYAYNGIGIVIEIAPIIGYILRLGGSTYVSNHTLAILSDSNFILIDFKTG